MNLLRCGSVLLAFVPGVAIAQHAGDANSGASFIDRFTTLDTRRWYMSDGWANGKHQNCTWSAANIRVSRAIELSLTDKPSKDRQFSCAELQSKAFFGYGTYEVRMRAETGPGLVTAFFTYTGPPHGRPHDEIDVEILGKASNEVFLNVFANGRGNSQTAKLPFDSTATAHDYAFQWLPDSLRWFADGQLIREVKQSAETPLPNTLQKLYISIWNGTGWDQEAWLGRFSYPGRPLVARYEYLAFTRSGEPCHFPESIVCKQAGGGKQ